MPDLIFVDLRLPGTIDGFSLMRRLKAESTLRNIPAIVLTAFGRGTVENQAREAGCDGFLHKPADIRQIRAVIRAHLGTVARHTQVASAKTYRSLNIPSNL
jgi:DNA-binding response OmpR family regulator